MKYNEEYDDMHMSNSVIAPFQSVLFAQIRGGAINASGTEWVYEWVYSNECIRKAV